jgi:rhamnosyltransferase
MSIRVSVVIPTKNAGAAFRETLETVFAQDFPDRFEVIVIDSGSQDGTLDLCREYPVRILEIPPDSFNHGMTRNQAIGKAKGEFVALTVQDAVPADESWLAALARPMIDDPHVAAVYGPQIPRPEASHLARERNRLWYSDWRTPARQELTSAADWNSLTFEERRLLCRFDNVNGCLRRSTWQEIPLPPYAYAEDIGWARQVLEAGYAIVYEPGAGVIHSHDRDLAYEFRRAYVDAKSLALILDAMPQRLDVRQTELLFKWLEDEAAAYLSAFEEPRPSNTDLSKLLTRADHHWSSQASTRKEVLSRNAAASIPSIDAQDRTLHEPLFDHLTMMCLFGPDSAMSEEERAWLLGRLCWWAEDEDEEEAKAWYRALFDAECIAYLLGPESQKSDEDQKWVAWGWDRAERKSSRFGFRLGTPISRRLQGERCCTEEDIAFAFEVLWDELSLNFVKEAVAARLEARIESDRLDAQDLACMFGRLWTQEMRTSLQEAIYCSLIRRIEAAVAGKRPLSQPELDFISTKVWAGLKHAYDEGKLADLVADSHALPTIMNASLTLHNTIEKLCAVSEAESQLTHDRFWRARLYAAVMVVGHRLGEAAPRVRGDWSATLTQPTTTQQHASDPAIWWNSLYSMLSSLSDEGAFPSSLDELMASGV